MKNTWTVLLITLLLGISMNATAQPTLQKDYSFVMEIPSVITMDSSPAHLYVLSDTEGMAVFRTQPDTLQWLYSSTGMEQRGNTVTADIRFAYLFGNSRRLTVLEPTSVLGVYSSTILPSNPRMHNALIKICMWHLVIKDSANYHSEHQLLWIPRWILSSDPD